ncbi:MAG: BatA domain-containing protein [Bacteroidales bacterium]|nr:BatA domain-containing protein [Bacteroidales bacterium]
MTFSAPEVLWGLLAVAVPVVVHLFSFRRYRKVYFSNVEQLAELQAESRRQRQLKEWAVLLLRVLAVVFIVLAFARPVVGDSGAEEWAEGTTGVSVYVDNTHSMEASSSEGSRLDLAQRKAKEIVAAYPVGTKFQLLTADMLGSEMVWLGKGEFLERLDELHPTAASPLLSEVLACQLAFLKQGGAGAKQGYVVSDFQLGECDVAAWPQDSAVHITLVPLASVEVDNVYIDTLELDAPAYMEGGAVELVATIRNSGSKPVEQVPVKLLVNGHERAVATVDIAAGGAERALLRFVLAEEEWVDGCVEVADYPVVFDNRYYFSLHTRQAMRVKEWSGATGEDAFVRLFGKDTAVVYERSSLAESSLSTEWDIMVLNETGEITTGVMQQIADWVREGGCLLVIPAAGGDASKVEGINALLSILGSPTLGRWKEHPTRADRLDMQSALYRGVFNGKNEEMEMPSVKGHYTISGGTAHKAVISTSDGGSLLEEVRVDKGMVYLFTAPLSGGWTDLTAQALFVPTVYNMALYSRPQPQLAYTLGKDEVITLQGDYSDGRHPPELTDGNDLRIIPDVRRVGGRSQLLLHGEITHDGIVKLAEEHLAFNYSRRESRMEFCGREQLAAAMKDRAGYRLAQHPEKDLTAEIEAQRQGRQLWRGCIVMALLALAGEIFLLKQKKR